MSSLGYILIELNLAILLLSALFFMLRNKLSFTAQRFTIIAIPLLATLVLVLKSLTLKGGELVITPIIKLDLVTVGAEVGGQEVNGFNWTNLYWLGVSAFLVWLAFKLVKVFYFFRSATIDQSLNIRLLISSKKDSFSFFNLIHLNADLSEAEKHVVLDHELVHANQNHTRDLIIMEVYHALFWFNPLFFWLKKALVYAQEYEVDQEMYGRYKSEYLKVLIAQSLGVNSAQLLLTSQFYNGLSLTKRTKKMKENKIRKNGLLVLLPLLACGFIFVSWSSFLSVDDLVYHQTGLDQEGDKVYEVVDVAPQFVGGEQAMIDYLVKEVKYPEQAKAKGKEATVYIEFIIRKTGQVELAKVVRPGHPELDAEALRVIDAMPDWIPGELDGKKVDVRFVIPISFKLTNE